MTGTQIVINEDDNNNNDSVNGTSMVDTRLKVHGLFGETSNMSVLEWCPKRFFSSFFCWLLNSPFEARYFPRFDKIARNVALYCSILWYFYVPPSSYGHFVWSKSQALPVIRLNFPLCFFVRSLIPIEADFDFFFFFFYWPTKKQKDKVYFSLVRWKVCRSRDREDAMSIESLGTLNFRSEKRIVQT